jgi:hypothetical protein
MRTRTPELGLAWITVITLGLGLIPAAVPVAADEALPQVSKDGLQLQARKGDRIVYLKSGARFDQYKRVAILECYVEFAKDWQRDYNDQAATLGQRVTTADMDRIKSELAAEFKKVFAQELQKNGGYEVVDVAAPDVLVLRPALVNLRVTAPDLMSAGMSTVVVSSAGQMTLYLELWDSSSSTILARVIDPGSDVNYSRNMVANRVTNTAEARRLLESWAQSLRRHLDAVHAVSS